jgi:hypothetical protein
MSGGIYTLFAKTGEPNPKIPFTLVTWKQWKKGYCSVDKSPQVARNLQAESVSFTALWTWRSMGAGDPVQRAKVGTPPAHEISHEQPKNAPKTKWFADRLT